MPILGSGAAVPCETTEAPILTLLQLAAAVTVAVAAVALQLAATTI